MCSFFCFYIVFLALLGVVKGRAEFSAMYPDGFLAVAASSLYMCVYIYYYFFFQFDFDTADRGHMMKS